MSETGSYEVPPSAKSKEIPGMDDVAKSNGEDNMDLRRSKRTLKRTDKGKTYQYEVEKCEHDRLYRRLQRQGHLIKALLESQSNKEKVSHEAVEFDKTFADLVAGYGRLRELVDDEEQHHAAAIAMDELDNEVFQFKTEIYMWQAKYCENVAQGSNKSVYSQGSKQQSKAPLHRSGSSSSSKSSRRSAESSKHSGVSSRSRNSHVSQKAEAAGLRAEAALFEQTRNAELQAELLRYEQKIRKAEAIQRVYAEEEEKQRMIETGEKVDDSGVREDCAPGEGEVKFQVIEPQDEKNNLRAREQHTPAKDERKSKLLENEEQKDLNIRRSKSLELKDEKQSDTDTLAESLLQVLHLQSAPKVQVDVFSGNILEYQYFIATFHEVVERLIPDQRGRLARLIQFTAEEPKELIKHCIHDDATTCYTTAMSLLEKYYGDPHRIACAYIKELRRWPNIKANDASAFRSLNRFLIKCNIYKRKGNLLRELDSPDIITTLVTKLPLNLQDKWNRKVENVKRKDLRMADFSDFADFIDVESTLTNDPLYSREALYWSKDKTSETMYKVKNLATKCEEEVVALHCPMCKEAHDLEDCQQYKDLPREGRYEFLYNKRLCYACYNVTSDGHMSYSCKRKRICKVCKGQHPTGLHNYDSINARSTFTYPFSTGLALSVCVIPVRLSHRDSPEKEIVVYAVLDDCSMGTFVLDSVVSGLMVPNQRSTSLTIKTMTGTVTETSTLVEGLIVRCSSQHAKDHPLHETIHLPGTYTRSMIPIEEREIPTPESIKSWKHLQCIIKELPEYDSSIPVGLLIGVNCPKALEPREVIPSAHEGPYAFRSQLGWCVVGPLITEGEAVRCNLTSMRIAVKDAATNTVAKHHFAVQNELEDLSVKEMLLKIYDSEVSEANSEKKAFSGEDDKFMLLMMNHVHLIDGHYELPLPFRQKDVRMPSNREQVLKRTEALKRKFLKNPEFHKDYVEFMNNLLVKGYACRSENESRGIRNWRGWFLPHHGLYNPNKPGKMRVVFDCSAVYGGKSLNSELLQGPDLTNRLIGVLTRFRKEEVPFMADIEKMFYQVKIPVDQRRFVRFLWWSNGDLSQELHEFEMCVHLFGAVSSPGCSNFALRQAAVDGSRKFGNTAYLTVMHDFYVDDLLKSCHSDEEAGNLAVAVDQMCASGGFNLTKFVSSSSLLIGQLPPEKRAETANDILLPDHDSIERALGVEWCIEKDTLKFRITLQDKPLTRRGILSTISSIYDPLGLAGPFLIQGKKILQEVTAEKGEWDDHLSDEYAARWQRWRSEVILLENLEVNRCFKPKGFGKVVNVSLHIFSDASECAYGACSYLRQVNSEGQIHVALVMAKSRVTPSKLITIPRLELNDATLSANLGVLLKEELMIDDLEDKYWVDSKIVLGYIFNEVKRFRTQSICLMMKNGRLSR